MSQRNPIDLTPFPAVMLDSSALLAYFTAESNAPDLQAFRSKCRIPFMTLYELHSVLTRKRDRALADRYFGIIRSWDVPVLHSSDEMILSASRLRRLYGLGTGDAFIAAASVCERLPLLTYDTDFLPLRDEITLLGIK